MKRFTFGEISEITLDMPPRHHKKYHISTYENIQDMVLELPNIEQPFVVEQNTILTNASASPTISNPITMNKP